MTPLAGRGPGAILALNCGSSSVKHALFDGETAVTRATVAVPGGGSEAGHDAAVEVILGALDRGGIRLSGVGHRVVSGGPSRSEPALVDERLLADLRAAIPFAPLHLPAEIAAMEAVRSRHPDLPQVACFDTYFHRTLPERTARYPIPTELFERGVRRYGFHGLSYEHVVASLGPRLGERAIIAHLGSGASLAAVFRGASVDTTMGFTPTGGLVMSTRTGDLDPGLLIHLLAHEGYDAASLDDLVNHRGGLLALSGTTGDMRALLAAEASDPRAALAVDVFCRQVQKGIGAMAAVLGGVDHLVFTGGIGAHATEIRARILARLGFLGIPASCAVTALVTDEEQVVARHTAALLAAGPVRDLRDPG